jgi:hypothetical protein
MNEHVSVIGTCLDPYSAIIYNYKIDHGQDLLMFMNGQLINPKAFSGINADQGLVIRLDVKDILLEPDDELVFWGPLQSTL